jgi:gliding motility associated protien GldN
MKRLSFVFALLFVVNCAYSQVLDSQEGQQKQEEVPALEPIRQPVDAVYQKIHHTRFKPIMLTPSREADVLWTQLLWRYIDLAEKFNHPLYYPTEAKGNWKSLIQTLTDALRDTLIEEEEPLRLYTTEYCNIPNSISGLFATMGRSIVVPLQDEWGNDTGQKVQFVPFMPSEVYRYELFEQTYIDKQRSIMESRIISICPYFWIIPDDGGGSYEGSDGADEELAELAGARRWRRMGYFYYPEVRPILAVTEVFNPGNNAQRRTYDDIFLMRRFQSYVAAQENVHDDRAIREYTVNGMDQRLESDAILNKIRVREHEMWEY